jgi:recombination protein RecR
MSELDTLIGLLAKLPGLGPRSARRAALHLIKRRESIMEPLAVALRDAAAAIRPCSVCGNLDTIDPCSVCADPRRDATIICVVEDLADLWALERTAAFRGRYHVLGGTLSALDGVGPEELNIGRLIGRLAPGMELILALNATVDGANDGALHRRPRRGDRCHGVAPGARRADRRRARLPRRRHRDRGTQSQASSVENTIGGQSHECRSRIAADRRCRSGRHAAYNRP